MIAATLAMLLLQVAPNYDWRTIPDDVYDIVATTTDKAEWSVQHKAVLRALMDRPRQPTFWIKVDFRNVKSERARFLLEKVTIDCDREVIFPTAATYYAPDGSIIQQGGPRLPTEDIVPGSAFSTMKSVVCK